MLRARRAPSRLAFIVVDFPDAEGTIVHSINLSAIPVFAALLSVESKPKAATETIQDNLDLNLRSDARNKARKEGVSDSTPHGPQSDTSSSKEKTPEKGDSGPQADDDKDKRE